MLKILTKWNNKFSSRYILLLTWKKKIAVPINHRETFKDLIEQSVDFFAEKDTDLGKTNTIKISINTGKYTPIQLRPYRTPFAKYQIVDREGNDMLAANIIHPSRSP